MTEESRNFKDPTLITKFLIYIIYINIILAVASLISDAIELQFILQVKNNFFASVPQLTEAAESNDTRQAIVGMFQALLGLPCSILLLIWIYRASHNTRALGADDMSFTPGWSVGWYFIPVFNFWKPYQAMKEIWKASSAPDSWKSIKTSTLLYWWWTLWIIYILTAQVASQLVTYGTEINTFLTANILTILCNATSIPLFLVFLKIVDIIYRNQISNAKALYLI